MHQSRDWCAYRKWRIANRDLVIRDVRRKEDSLDNAALLNELKTQLRNAITSNFAELKLQFDDLCGFAVCAPSYFEQIFPAYQRSTALAGCGSDSLGINTYFPPQWESFGTLSFDDHFNDLAARISERRCTNAGIDANDVFNAILDVLVNLECDGVFGPRSGNRFVTMWDVGSDESLILTSSEKLNSKDVHTSVLKTFGRTN